MPIAEPPSPEVNPRPIAELPSPETDPTPGADHTDTSPDAPERQTFLRPRRAARRDWLRAGFFATLGAGLMALLALVAWHFFRATLDIALPFVVGLVLALLLDPLADKMERRGLGRTAAAGLVFAGLLALIVGAGFLIVPALINQASDLATNGATYIGGIQTYIGHFLTAHHGKLGPLPLPKNLDALSAQISQRASGLLQLSTGKVAGYLIGSVTLLIQMVLALIITFFLLVDLDRLRARLFFLAPSAWRDPMDKMGRDVGGVFSDYLRGLLIVCALYGAATIALLYGLSLVHHGLARYALIVGVAAGVLYAVPYVGSTSTALVTFLVAFAAGAPSHSGLSFGGGAVLATLAVNQVFDNVVTPRVVGGGVGLHPVMALFALVLGGEMFGIWGMLLSVPVAASLQVILFRLFPRLTTATPPPFLRAHGVRPGKGESAKIGVGDQSSTAENQRRENA